MPSKASSRPGRSLVPCTASVGTGVGVDADALLQALQCRIAIRRMERVAIVAERRRHHAGLTERRLHALDDGRGIEFRRGVSPPVLEEGKVVGGHDLLGVRHLKEVGVPDAFVALVARGEVAAEGRGMGRADGDDALDALGGERGRAIRGRGPPVVTDQEGALRPQRSDERHRILGQQDRLIPAVRRRRGGRISPHERRDTAKTGGRQDGQEVAVRVGVVGEPVETQDERPPPHLQIVKRHTVGCCVTGSGLHVGSPGVRGALLQHRGRVIDCIARIRGVQGRARALHGSGL